MNRANERPFEDFAKHMHGLPEFHYAALTGKEDLLRKMLSDDSIIISSVDIYGRTALHIAASHDKYSSLKLLCKQCSKDKETLDRSDSFGYTALHYAVQGANTYCAKLLLDSGCDVNPTQHSKCTPLHLAALYGYPELVALLCERGANVHARSSFQETPLQMATRSGIRIREKLKVRLTLQQAKKFPWWPVRGRVKRTNRLLNCIFFRRSTRPHYPVSQALANIVMNKALRGNSKTEKQLRTFVPKISHVQIFLKL